MATIRRCLLPHLQYCVENVELFLRTTKRLGAIVDLAGPSLKFRKSRLVAGRAKASRQTNVKSKD
jgi:hypothetical protein